MIDVTGVFPKKSVGVMITPAMFVKEQVNCSLPPAMATVLLLSVSKMVSSDGYSGSIKSGLHSNILL